jgi:hypothetical protein
MVPATVEATTATAMATATVTETATLNHNQDNVNQIRRLVRLVVTERRKTTSNLIVLNTKETMHQWCKKKNLVKKTANLFLCQKYRFQFLCHTKRELHRTIQEEPIGSLNIEMIIKMCTWKIAENMSLANRLNKSVNPPHITVKPFRGQLQRGCLIQVQM